MTDEMQRTLRHLWRALHSPVAADAAIDQISLAMRLAQRVREAGDAARVADLERLSRAVEGARRRTRQPVCRAELAAAHRRIRAARVALAAALAEVPPGASGREYDQ